ncbi:hypothetical protein [Paracidovorax sp. MALMAid1276]|uniref:hypothetical protein n=1 Tax=Paracidovorax sp. MALMAid1276 TaxID=3411631 RepID=UPI003B9D433B
MAVWLTALKLVPWGDVIEATPQILNAAKKLMRKSRTGGTEPPAGTLGDDAGDANATPLEAQVKALGQRVAQLEQEQRDSAALIESLAEQNAVVVRAVEALRKRSQRLTAAAIVLGATCAALAVWVLRQP